MGLKKKPQRKDYWAGDTIENDLKRFTKAIIEWSEKAEKHIKLLEDCREYDASGKNRPDGYIVPNYYTGKRQDSV